MMPGTNPPPAISTLRHEYVSAAGAAAAGAGVAWGATRAAATTVTAASACVIRMIDHFLVGSFAGRRAAGRRGRRSRSKSTEEHAGGALRRGLGALPAEDEQIVSTRARGVSTGK